MEVKKLGRHVTGLDYWSWDGSGTPISAEIAGRNVRPDRKNGSYSPQRHGNPNSERRQLVDE